MRLLNTSTLKLENFVRDIPLYVILSHTWGDEEVTFDDIDKPYAQDMLGYQKIEGCCRQAVKDGFDYVWIDTCSIDKKSSAELSEAINSMYTYYQRAEICYVYLSDVPSNKDPSIPKSKFARSRWFQRGWTLQELLAPDVVEFYSSDWCYLGTKRNPDLLNIIQDTTGIDHDVLFYPYKIRFASIAQIFSWASRRKTTREEDIAYCLMGLVDVNMPLLYGEGEKAFIRLQSEIVKRTNEHSFLCWENSGDRFGVEGPFCASILGFKDCNQVRNMDNSQRAGSHSVTNKGLEIRLPCKRDSSNNGEIVAILNCEFRGNRIAIRLRDEGEGLHSRVKYGGFETIDDAGIKKAVLKNLVIIGKRRDLKTYEPVLYECVAEIGLLNSKDDRFRVHRVIKGFELQMPGIHHGMTDEDSINESSTRRRPFDVCVKAPEAYRPQEQYKILNNHFIGLLFGDGFSSFLVVLGLHRQHVWSRAIPSISVDGMESASKKALEDIRWYQQVFGRDHVVQTVQDGINVTFSAKKRASKGSIVWTFNIDI